MYTLSIDNILAAHTALGIVCAVLLFAFCFSIVHLARLVKFGWKYQKKQSKPEPKPQEQPKQEQPVKEKIIARHIKPATTFLSISFYHLSEVFLIVISFIINNKTEKPTNTNGVISNVVALAVNPNINCTKKPIA